jgi:hypothetical protein
MQGMIGAACRLPGEEPLKGVAMRREFVCGLLIVFIDSHDTYL